MVEIIGGRHYSKIYQKTNQVRCIECVFLTINDTPFQRLTIPHRCTLSERPIRDADHQSCPKGKVPL